jgi:hypothetical protein
MGNREAATKAILKYIEKIIPGSPNTNMYKELLGNLSDKAFDEYMKKLQSGEETLYMVTPNLADYSVDVQRNIEIAKELGHSFFEKLWLTDPITGQTYLTPVEYFVIDLPLRRQVQLLVKKVSIPEDNKHLDQLTGQPTGPSKGSKISFPELQVLFAQGLDNTISELIKFRGGDEKAYNAMNRSIYATGGVSLANLEKTPTKVKAVTTLSTLLKAMHLDNTL